MNKYLNIFTKYSRTRARNAHAYDKKIYTITMKKQFNVRIDEDLLHYMHENHWSIGKIINAMLRKRIEEDKRRQLLLKL